MERNSGYLPLVDGDERDADVPARALARDGDGHRRADAGGFEGVPQIVLALHGLAIDGDDPIAQHHAPRARDLRSLESRLRGRAIGQHVGDRDAIDPELRVVAVRAERDADASLRDAPGADELRE